MSKPDLSRVFGALVRRPNTGQAVMFISARGGEGTSPLVRQALNEAALAQSCYAIDLDVRRNGLARTLVAEGAVLSPAVDASLAGAVLFEAVCMQRRILPLDKPIFSFHRIQGTKNFVGAFHPKALPQGAHVLVCDAPQFWIAARKAGATIVVDAPALERSKVGLIVARRMDGVVLVVGDEDGAAPAAMAAKQALIDAGANLIGLIYTEASAAKSSARAKPDRGLKRAS